MNHDDDPDPDGLSRRRHLKTWLVAGAFVQGPLSLAAARVAQAAASAEGRAVEGGPAAGPAAAAAARDTSSATGSGGEPGTSRASGAAGAPGMRLVVLGGTLTEIVFALGAGGLVVGTDQSSMYPPAARKLPQVGYYRQFSAEGVAALKPDLVIAAAESGPPQAMRALKRLGIRVETLSLTHEVATLTQRVQDVAGLLGRAERGRELAAQIRAQVAHASRVKRPVRVIAVSRHAGRLAGAGRGTAADALFQLLGARNLLADAHQGYKPLSAESLAALRPDVIVTSSLSVADGGVDALRSEPGFSTTPAARSGHIIVLDDLLLLGFGPRVGEALRQLHQGFVRIGAPAGRVASGSVPPQHGAGSLQHRAA